MDIPVGKIKLSHRQTVLSWGIVSAQQNDWHRVNGMRTYLLL